MFCLLLYNYAKYNYAVILDCMCHVFVNIIMLLYLVVCVYMIDIYS